MGSLSNACAGFDSYCLDQSVNLEMHCAEQSQSRRFFDKPKSLMQGVKSVFSRQKSQELMNEVEHRLMRSDKSEEIWDKKMDLQDIGFGVGGAKKAKESGSFQEKNSNESDLFQELIDLQGSSGLFKWGKAMEKAFQMKEDEINIDMGVEKEIWITALVVVYFQQKMPDKKDLWELIVDKAVKEMKKKIGDVKEILERAEKIVH